MKKIIFALLVLLPFILSVQAQAQTATVSSAVNDTATPSGILSPTVTQIIKLFMVRLKAAVLRADNISLRLNSRMAKLTASGQMATGSASMIKISTQQKTLTNQLDKLKSDLQRLDLASQTVITSLTPLKDYSLFKNQALTFTKNLRDVFKTELDLVTSIKQFIPVTVTPSIQPIGTAQ